MGNTTLHSRGLMIVTLGVFILSFDALLVRLASTPAANVVFWRGMFTFLALGILLWIGRSRSRLNLRPFGALFASGAVAGVGLVMFPLSVTHTDTANTVVILTSAPFFAAIFSRLFLAERVPLRTWLAIIIVAAGITTIFSGSISREGRFGDAMALIAAANFGINMTILRAVPELSRIAVTCLSGLVACIVCLPFVDPFWLPTTSMGYLALSGLFQMPAAMVLISIGTRFLPAPEVSLLLLVETLLAPVWIFMVFAEEPTRATLYGGAMILATLLVHSWIGLRRQRSA